MYNHWGPVDEHKTLPTERLNELFGSMASYYKPPTKQVALLKALACATKSSGLVRESVAHQQSQSESIFLDSFVCQKSSIHTN